jgi:hypothetical protein
MEMKRKITLGAAALAVALGAGHLVQSGQFGALADREADAGQAKPTGITPLRGAAGAEDAIAAAPPLAVPAAAVALPPSPAPASPASASVLAPVPAAPPATTLASAKPDLPSAARPAPQTPAADLAEACSATLDVMPGANGMLDLTLLAPCKPGTRVVLRHGGLAVTGRTSDGGALFTALPAMEAAGEVSALFPDGTVARGAAAVDMGGIRRFAVQWMADDRFALNAYRDGAAFGEAGHVHAGSGKADPAQGWVMPLGDATVDLPMMAEVYTWPATPANIALDIEAPVTEATCNREMLAETVESQGGAITRSDIALAMPDCAAVGDFLVLNNHLAGMTTAAAE